MPRLDIKVDSIDATLSLASQIGHNLKGGELIVLVSDVGGGKTTFVRGLTKGAESTSHVRSPSFTLENQYLAKNFIIHHFDFYRLTDPGIMQNMLAEVVSDNRSVIVIEWGDIVSGVLPSDKLTIEIVPTSETGRSYKFSYSHKQAYLINNLTS